MRQTISYDDAICIATRFAEEIASGYENEILAVFAIGSLGSDYYRPGQSDIDTAVITSCTRQDLRQVDLRITEAANRYWKEYHVPKGFGAIVFSEEQLYPPYQKNEELVLEILRLKTQARLLYGFYDVAAIPMPNRQAIVADARAFQAWADAEKERNPEFKIDSVQTLVNSTLIALKRYLMIEHGIIEFNKFKVIDLYLNHTPPLVNETVFAFINLALQDEAPEISEAEFAQMVEWHDMLYRVVNERVLLS